MRKTLLITKFFPPEHGGIQNYLYNLVLGLPEEKIFVMTKNNLKTQNLKLKTTTQNLNLNNTKTSEIDAKFPFKVYHHNFSNFWRHFHLTTFYLFFKARRIIEKEKIEKVLCGHLPLAGPITLLIKQKYRIPYFLFTYGSEIFLFKNLDFRRQKLYKKVIDNAEKIIVIADFMAEYLKKEFGINAEKIVKIPPGVDINKFKNQKSKIKITTQNLKLENFKIILTCGRLVARKNHISVIRALPQIIKEIPNALYLIAGTGPEEQNLKNEVKKLSLEKYAKFLGEVAQKDLPTLYQCADIFVMPSREILEKGDIEGFGVVFLEAAASGLPCIAGNTGGQAEAVKNEKTGLLVNPESINEIAAAILKILKNPEMAENLGKAGRDRVIKEFEWKKQTEKLKSLLE